MITNNFMPRDGRLPTLIAIISMFFVGVSGGAFNFMLSALPLTLFIILGVCMISTVSEVLSMTALKEIPPSFTLELPPCRRPRIGKMIVRSTFDRTLFILGKAVMVAAPVGSLIWIMANVQLDSVTLLVHSSGFLDPSVRLPGMDGVVPMAFILGLPTDEIVIPIITMTYMIQGSPLESDSLTRLGDSLVNNDRTWIAAVSTILLSLMHWSYITTLLTIREEPGGLKWTAMPFLAPMVCSIVLYFAFATAARMFI